MSSVMRQAFHTTGIQGLRHDILPMRLYHKAKRLGVWDPRALDFAQDVQDWQRCTPEEQETLIILTSLFQAGEESVTLDLLPLISTIAQEGRLEEEMFLTTFLWEEAKHTEFFRRFLDEIAVLKRDLHGYHSPSYRKIFYEALPEAMHALYTDRSPEAQLRASCTYNMIVEGVLAETGYQAYFDMLERNRIMPGIKQGITYLKRDESRHIAYGIFLISRLVAAQPALWHVVEETMNTLLPYALGVIQEADAFLPADKEQCFGIKLENYVGFALTQFNKRVARIQQARTQQVEELYTATDEETA